MDIQWEAAERVIQLLAGFSTVAVGWFAWVQVHHQREDSKERQRAAYASLYAEYLRLSSLSEMWDSEDLVELSWSNALRPEDLLPPDWGTLLRLLGEVGSATSALGAMAYETVSEAARRVRLINHMTESLPPANAEGPARELERQVKHGVKLATEIFEDAMRSAPSWLTTHPITLVHPRSEVGLKLGQAFRDAKMRTQGDRHEPRLGFVGRRLGRSLHRVARWFDPAVG